MTFHLVLSGGIVGFDLLKDSETYYYFIFFVDLG